MPRRKSDIQADAPGQDSFLDVVANLMGKRYPWLSVKARASITSAYIYTYK